MKNVFKRPYLYFVFLLVIFFCARPVIAAESLADAVRAGDKKKLEALIAASAEVEGKDGGLALCGAITRKMYDIASMLVTKGADLNTHGPRYGFTPLHETVDYVRTVYAVPASNAEQVSSNWQPPDLGHDLPPMDSSIMKNKVKLAELLIAHGADVNAGNNNGYTPLHRAGSVELAEILIRHGAKVNAMDFANSTPLYNAIHISKALVELLIANGADVNNIDKSGNTPLHIALYQRRADIAGLLISRGADVNIKDRDGWTLLEMALQSKNAEFAKLLMANGAKASASNRPESANLDLAINTSDLSLVETMLKNGEMKKASRSPLFAAVAGKQKEMVELLLRYGADVNTGVKEGSPLLLTVRDKDILKLLLEHGADPNVKDRKGDSLLWYVCYDSELAELLLRRGADINIKNRHGRTVLHLASRYARDEVVKWLLTHGANVNAVDDDGLTPFFDALKSYERRSASPMGKLSQIGISADKPAIIGIPAGISASELKKLMQESTKATPARDLEMPFPVGFDTANSQATVKLLLSHGAKVDVADRLGQTPLHLAPTGEIADLLLRKGINVNARSANGMTALFLAAVNGRADVVEVLLKKGSDPNARRADGATALHRAAAKGGKDVVELLLKHGANANAIMREDVTPLHLASTSEVVNLLLKNGADVNARSADGATALHLAAGNGMKSVVELLLKHGANANAAMRDGITPLHNAKGVDVAQTLLTEGARADAADNRGNTPLHFANEAGAVKLLLRYGAPLNKRNNSGQTPLMYSIRTLVGDFVSAEDRSSKEETVRALLDHGADVGMEDNEHHAPSYYLRVAIAKNHFDTITEQLQELDDWLVARGAPAAAPNRMEATKPRPVIPPELAGIPQIILGTRTVMQTDARHEARLKSGRESHLYYLEPEGELPANGYSAFDDARQLLDYYQRQLPEQRGKGLWVKRMAKQLQGPKDAKSADKLTGMARSEGIPLFLCDPAMPGPNGWYAEWECKQVSPGRMAQAISCVAVDAKALEAKWKCGKWKQ